MKIAIADIPDEGLSIDIREKLILPDLVLFSPLTARLDLTKAESEIIIRGMMDVEVGLQCSRCLRDFRRHLELPVDVVYHELGEIPSDSHELKDDEMDMGFYSGEEIDVQELLKEQIFLNMQMKPLCDESCRGICPKCGTDLNVGTCTCETREGDPRLDALKNYFEKRKE